MILTVIAATDCEGIIVSEYEDHASGKAGEQVRLHLAMMRKLLWK